MSHLLRPVLPEGVVGFSLVCSPEIILLVVLNKRAICVDVLIAVRVDEGLRTLVLVVENYVGVSIYTLDTDAETV